MRFIPINELLMRLDCDTYSNLLCRPGSIASYETHSIWGDTRR